MEIMHRFIVSLCSMLVGSVTSGKRIHIIEMSRSTTVLFFLMLK